MTTITTTAAATQAGVTIATVRTWARHGIIAATKQAGRWVIDTASLAHRIAIGARRARKQTAMTQPTPPAPMSRTEFEEAAAQLGIKATFKDARCHGEYLAYQATGQLYSDTVYDMLLVRRGAALAAEGYTPPAPRSHPHECHTCGLDARTCDCR